MQHFEIAFVMLFAVASAVAMGARALKIPYTVALVAAGLVLGTTHAFSPPRLTKELLYAVFLPGLLFEAAFHLELKRFLRNKLAIFALAVPGVIVSIALTGLVLTPVASALRFVDGFTLGHGLVFGALIAATDPIAVVAMFKSFGAPKRLGVVVEGESLLNDGTAVVLFTLIIGVVAGGRVSAAGAALEFVKVVGMGLVIGTAVGLAASRIIHKVDDAMIEITLTTIAAYGAFVGAEYFHYSGVIATVTSGMLCGNYAARSGMSPSTRLAVESFWEYLAFALNSIVFLLIGFEVRIESLLAAYKPILVAFVAVLLARAVVVGLVSLAVRRTRERMPWSWTAVLIWGGLRGGLSMVLVLALPAHFAHRDLLVTMTFGVVLLSILLQGLSMAPLMKRLGVVKPKEDRELYELRRGELRATGAAIDALDDMTRERTAHPDVLAALRAEYAERRKDAEDAIRALHIERQQLRDEELRAARRHLLLLEKKGLLEALSKGIIGAESCEKLVADVDARLVGLDHGDDEPPSVDVPRRPMGSAGDAVS